MSRPISGRLFEGHFALAVEAARSVTPSAMDRKARSMARGIVDTLTDHGMTRTQAFEVLGGWAGASARAVKKLCGQEAFACRPHIYERLRLLHDRICTALERDIECSKAILDEASESARAGGVAAAAPDDPLVRREAA